MTDVITERVSAEVEGGVVVCLRLAGVVVPAKGERASAAKRLSGMRPAA